MTVRVSLTVRSIGEHQPRLYYVARGEVGDELVHPPNKLEQQLATGTVEQRRGPAGLPYCYSEYIFHRIRKSSATQNDEDGP